MESFAWANCQPIEYYESTAKHRGVDGVLWEKIRNAGRVFYGFKHILTTLDPDVVVILHKNIPSDYFEGVNIQKIEGNSFYEHYIAKTADKYEFIFALAKYLQSHNIYMSYNGLAELLNYCGYTTNRGTQYIVNSKRARIIGTAYRRAKDKNDHSLAETIATVFVNPNFSYKYE